MGWKEGFQKPSLILRPGEDPCASRRFAIQAEQFSRIFNTVAYVGAAKAASSRGQLAQKAPPTARRMRATDPIIPSDLPAAKFCREVTGLRREARRRGRFCDGPEADFQATLGRPADDRRRSSKPCRSRQGPDADRPAAHKTLYPLPCKDDSTNDPGHVRPTGLQGTKKQKWKKGTVRPRRRQPA